MTLATFCHDEPFWFKANTSEEDDAKSGMLSLGTIEVPRQLVCHLRKSRTAQLQAILRATNIYDWPQHRRLPLQTISTACRFLCAGTLIDASDVTVAITVISPISYLAPTCEDLYQQEFQNSSGDVLFSWCDSHYDTKKGLRRRYGTIRQNSGSDRAC